MGISESLSFCEERTNSKEIDFSYSTLTYLAVLVAVTFSNLFDASVVKTLVVTGLIILYLSMGYYMQT